MATEVLIPKLGMTMTEGTVAEWLVPDGAEVRSGDLVYRLETEKIDIEVEVDADGILRHLVPVGTTLPPGSVVAYVLAVDEALPSASPGLRAQPGTQSGSHPTLSDVPNGAVTLEGGRIAASPIARRLAKEAGLELAAIAGSGPRGRITEADVSAAQIGSRMRQVSEPERVLASPLARRAAEALGIGVDSVRGSGPGGRVTLDDVETAANRQRGTGPLNAAQPAPPASSSGPLEIIPLRGMRKVIADRMLASLHQMAQLSMEMSVTMDDAIRLRNQLVEEWAGDGVRLSYTDLVIKAVAKALGRHPSLNAKVTDVGIELQRSVHVGMAVALEPGLVVPVIRDADSRPLRDIASDSGRLVAAARAGKLGLDEMAGQTFSVTALGSAGVDFFTPIINPPNVAILGVGRIRDAVGWQDERPIKRSELTLSLTIDHRAVDGLPAAAFLEEVRGLLEAPYRLLV
jgi:pyruvate dehydrogenase E2 component (dihydrolipoamide acetyltransferase)